MATYPVALFYVFYDIWSSLMCSLSVGERSDLLHSDVFFACGRGGVSARMDDRRLYDYNEYNPCGMSDFHLA